MQYVVRAGGIEQMTRQLKAIRFTSIVLVALALSASMAHLLALPNKIRLDREDYFVAQQLYRGWSLLGIVVIGALLSTLLLTILVRGQGTTFALTFTALLCLTGAQIVFWIFIFPANQQTDNWTHIPSHWEDLRRQWEYAHAAGAVLNFASFCLLALSLLTTSNTKIT
ncbi:MAG TPA: hypothetical protein VD816_13605 [Ohtaekwangia sp.]|nr:hypothetical protein [Ohtaekwangia sp.]